MTLEKPKKPVRGRPFRKKDPVTGELDPRIHATGRPKGAVTASKFRALAKEIAADLVKGQATGDAEMISRAEQLLKSWSLPTAHPSLQIMFAKYVAGSPDQKVQLIGALGTLDLGQTDIDPAKLKEKLLSLADFEIVLEDLRDEEVDDEGSPGD